MLFSNKTSSGFKALPLAMIIGSGFVAGTAQAQIEEIIVTAQKRAESLQDVAVAVTAFTGEQLRAGNVVEPRDLFQKMPNVSVQTNGSAGQLQLSIRGVSFATFSPIGVQPVMVFQDEVVLNSPQVAGLFIFDSERVEVLRGPQNTLYGRNTTGGAVNFISRKPEIGGGADGYTDISIGNNESVDVNAAIGAEISDNAAIRLAMQSLNTAGHWDNLNIPGDKMGERNQNLFRAQLAWQPAEATHWLFNLHGGSSRGGQRPFKAHGLSIPGQAPFFNDGSSGDGPACNNLNIDDFNSRCISIFDELTPNGETHQVYSELRNDRDDIEAFGGSVRFEQEFGGFTFMSLTAFETNEYDHWEENDGLRDTSFVLFRQKSDTDTWTQEFRLTSAADTNLRWIAGAFALLEEASLNTTVAIFADEGASGRLQQDTDMWSVFGQMEYDFSERLTLTGGLRYVYEKKEGANTGQAFSGLGGAISIERPDAWLFNALAPFSGAQKTNKLSESWNMWSGKLGLDFTVNENVLLYANLSRGEKGGQFTDAPEAALNGIAGIPADPETVLAWEAGLKATWADGSLQTNIALFFNDYTDQHVQITVPTADGGVASTAINAAESETSGVEADIIFAPGAGWTINLSLGVLSSEVTKASVNDTAYGVRIQEGRNLTNAPELTANLSVTKDFEFDNGNLLTVNFTGRYADEREFNLVDTPESRPFTTDPEYTLLDAWIEYRFGADNRFKFGAWGKNLTDELYFNHIQEFGIGNAIAFASNPRQYGISVGVDF